MIRCPGYDNINVYGTENRHADMVELADTQVLGACARAYGFESHYPHHIRPHGQAVKTSPFHGGNSGSIPDGVTKNEAHCLDSELFFHRYINGEKIAQKSNKK